MAKEPFPVVGFTIGMVAFIGALALTRNGPPSPNALVVFGMIGLALLALAVKFGKKG